MKRKGHIDYDVAEYVRYELEKYLNGGYIFKIY
jgi:hypothetical protein